MTFMYMYMYCIIIKLNKKVKTEKIRKKKCVYLQYGLPKLLKNGAERTLLFRYKLNKKVKTEKKRKRYVFICSMCCQSY